MLEPTEDLQAVFDRAIEIAGSHQHEYLTLEHVVLSIFTYEPFLIFIEDFSGETDFVKTNV